MDITFVNTCVDILGEIPGGAYTLTREADVRMAMSHVFETSGRIMTPSIEANIIFVINGIQAQWDSVLHDGDELKVFYKFMGG